MNQADNALRDAFRQAARNLGHDIVTDETVVHDNDGDAFVRIGRYPNRTYVFITIEEAQKALKSGGAE